MTFTIRELSEKDIPQVERVGLRSWLRTYSGIFSEEDIRRRVATAYRDEGLRALSKHRKETAFMVADDGDKVVGYVQPCLYNFWDRETFDPGKAMISRLYIDPDLIGRGLGSQLLAEAERWIKSRGFSSYYLFVHPDNKLGMDFYMRKGFVEDSRVEGECEILLRKDMV